MDIIVLVLLCALNFGISIWNANSVGKIWTEAKYIGGGVRILAVCGYIMAVAGFTMVYSIIIMAVIGATNGLGYLEAEQSALLLQFVSDLTYILIALAIIPTGIIITINSLVVFWKNKNIKTGAIGAWNTFATVSNVVNATRAMPSAFGRIFESVRKNRDSGVIVLAIAIVAICVLGGYFTASAIVKRADRKYDLFNQVAPGYATGDANPQGQPFAQGQQYGQPQGQGYAPNHQYGQQAAGYPPGYGQPDQQQYGSSPRSMAEREAELRRRQGM
ncbi:MAG: hypothetical protein LBG50_00455 [Clostridiales Family XIII bacterium]|jgi:hypothetical protein|nr:hypothetical protein [Clostridiales Family XIII bacterium]